MKKKTPIIIFVFLLILLLLAAFYFRDYVEKIILPEPEQKQKTLEECIKESNITLYGIRGSKITDEQISEIEELFMYINFVECSNNNEKCRGIMFTPAWKIGEHVYYNFFSKGTLIKIGECDGLQNRS